MSYKLTDNEIISGLECCVNLFPCEECPLDRDGGCRDRLIENALDLINRQKAEIERLNEYISRCKSGEEYWVKCLLERPNEAIKEFAERLKGKSTLRVGCVPWYDIQELINNLVKEMVGEDNE